MPIANTHFKVGDRVRYFGGGFDEEDYGTVMPDNVCNGLGWKLKFSDSICVKWESDGNILQVEASDVELADKQNTQSCSALTVQSCSELTVQSSIDFLISQGYTVSLSKN